VKECKRGNCNGNGNGDRAESGGGREGAVWEGRGDGECGFWSMKGGKGLQPWILGLERESEVWCNIIIINIIAFACVDKRGS